MRNTFFIFICSFILHMLDPEQEQLFRIQEKVTYPCGSGSATLLKYIHYTSLFVNSYDTTFLVRHNMTLPVQGSTF